MVSLNVSFGIFAFLPQGWLFMALIILLEAFIMSKLLEKKAFTKRISGTALLSNFVSGVAGIVTTIILNGGWILVVWFPWVSSHEINLTTPGALGMFSILYLVAFVLSVLIELIINLLMLKRNYKALSVLKATLIANAASYLFGSIVLYLMSGLIRF